MMPKRHEQRSRANNSKPLTFMLLDVWLEEVKAAGSTLCRTECLGAC